MYRPISTTDHRHPQWYLPLRRSTRRLSSQANHHLPRCRYLHHYSDLLYHLSLHGPEVKRSRDPKILDTCDIVVDVGAVYDESIKRFDHHQRGFTEVFGHGFNTKLSSAGLIYKCITFPHTYSAADLFLLRRHFGREIIANRFQLSQDDSQVNTLWLKLYKVLDLPSSRNLFSLFKLINTGVYRSHRWHR